MLAKSHSETRLPNVTLCILSFNRKSKLRVNLLKILKRLDYPKDLLQIIVVDNGSNDGSAEMIVQQFPQVVLIRRSNNIGVTAWNQAFSEGTGKYCVVLDDDAFLEGRTLLTAVERMESDPRLGILALRILAPHDGVDFTASYPTGKLSYWGCGAVLRKEMIDQIGGYDPRFFFQAFELDYSIRARVKGWSVDFAPELPVYHMTSTGGPQTSRKFYFSRRNLIIVAMKTFSGQRLVRILVDQIVTTWRFGSDQSYWNRIRACVDGIFLGLLAKLSVGSAGAGIQDMYASNFAEFAPARDQTRLWSDPAKQYWRDRPLFYPVIFDERPSGGYGEKAILLSKDSQRGQVFQKGAGWFAIPAEHEPCASVVLPLPSGDREWVSMRVSAPDDDVGSATARIDALIDGEVAATWRIEDVRDYPAISIRLPKSSSPVLLRFQAFADQKSQTEGLVYWSFIEFGGSQKEVPANPTIAHALSPLTEICMDVLPVSASSFEVQAFRSNSYLDLDLLPSLIFHQAPPRRLGTEELLFTRARVSELHYDGADYRSAMVRKRWMILHPPEPGSVPATVTFNVGERELRTFVIDVAYPDKSSEEATLMLEILDGKIVRSVGAISVPPGSHQTVSCELPRDKKFDGIRVSTRMAPQARNNYDASIYLLSARLQKDATSIAEVTNPKYRLAVFTHSLNVDGANAEVLHALEHPEFRNHFSDIVLVSPVDGRLRETVEDLGISVLWGYELLDLNQRTAILDSTLSRASTVWINTIDHSIDLWSALARAKRCRTLVFGHESMAPDSLVLPTIRWRPHFSDLLQELAARGDLTVAFPSPSTVRQARIALGGMTVEKISYGVDIGSRANRVWPNQLEKVEFVVPGWFSRRKNQESTIGLFEEVQKVYDANPKSMRDWRLTFAGTSFSNSEYMDFVSLATQRLPAAKLRFKSLLDHDAMLDLLRTSDVLLVNSLSEALPVTIIEMMMTGGIVLTSDVEGTEELISSDNGICFGRMDFAAACDCILGILDPQRTSMSQLREMSASALLSSSRYSVNGYLTQMLQLLAVRSDGTYGTGLFDGTTPASGALESRAIHVLPGTRIVISDVLMLDAGTGLDVEVRSTDDECWKRIGQRVSSEELLGGVDVPASVWSRSAVFRIQCENPELLSRLAGKLVLYAESDEEHLADAPAVY